MAAESPNTGGRLQPLRATLAGAGFTVVAMLVLVALMFAEGHCSDGVYIEMPFPLFAPFVWCGGRVDWSPMTILVGICLHWPLVGAAVDVVRWRQRSRRASAARRLRAV